MQVEAELDSRSTAFWNILHTASSTILPFDEYYLLKRILTSIRFKKQTNIHIIRLLIRDYIPLFESMTKTYRETENNEVCKWLQI